MKVIGIIAEYNPMHNGHIAQLKYARDKLNADYIIVAQSGNFTQRGIPTVIDKFERARLALEHGADLVLEIPSVGATASAAEFARSGVCTLFKTGVVTHLLFGAECSETERFQKAATLLENESFIFRKTLREHLKNGDTFAKARALAMDEAFPKENFGEFLSTPNNILGVEYVRALKNLSSDIEVHPMQRIESTDDLITDLSFGYTSSTRIRQILESGNIDDITPFVSENILNRIKESSLDNLLLFTDDFSILLHDRLIRSSNFSGHLDGNGDLSRRILKLRREFVSFKSFADRIKTKNITHSHIMRYLSHILLYITKEDHALLKEYSYAPYLHVLDFKKKASDLYSTICDKSDVPVFISPKEASNQLDAKAWTIFSKDIIASDIYRIIQTNKCKRSLPTEYTRHFEPME